MINSEVIEILEKDIERYNKNDIAENTTSIGLQAVLKHRKEKIQAYEYSIKAIEKNDKIIADLKAMTKLVEDCNKSYTDELIANKILLEECDSKAAEIEKLKNTWIPCSERLPDKTMQCLVTMIDMSNKIFVTERRFIEAQQSFFTSGKVIAWQPLPEPYKGE